jgi:ABC-type multidrug transport system fused ATPase/permease subunit
VHASTRILLLIIAIAVLLAGVWVLFSYNGVAVATGYSVAWTFMVLVATRVLLAIGSVYNSLRAPGSRRRSGVQESAASALEELTDLRSRNLISEGEYESKRATVLDRL